MVGESVPAIIWNVLSVIVLSGIIVPSSVVIVGFKWLRPTGSVSRVLLILGSTMSPYRGYSIRISLSGMIHMRTTSGTTLLC